MNLRDYLIVLRERFRIVLLGLVVGLGAGACLAFLSTPQFSSSTKFFISSRDTGADLNQAYQGSLLSEQKIKSYVGLARDRRIREQVEADLGSRVSPSAIQASAQTDTVLITITATDPSPVRATRIANSAAKAFADLVAAVERPEHGDAPVLARQILPASVPVSPVSPRKGVDLMLGALLGLMAGMSLAVARQALDRSVKSAQALAELVGAPIMGVTRFQTEIKARPLIVHDNPRAPLAEAFRQLRTNLEYVDLDRSHKLIMITSALPAEGKTTTACNLAIAIAQTGSRVALVEADLRRPRCAEYLGMENSVGLTSVLTGQMELEAVLQPWRGGLLDFLGSGPLPPNPSELLASDRMGTVLDKLGTTYDVVIFDAPPMLPVADAAVLAARCHGVLFVARHGWIRTDQVKAAGEMIHRVGAQMFGAVLSMAPQSKSAGGYGYQYSYTYSNRNPRNPVAPANSGTSVPSTGFAPTGARISDVTGLPPAPPIRFSNPSTNTSSVFLLPGQSRGHEATDSSRYYEGIDS
jgi:capsular exopolysaccharide synthesis family protein